MALQLYDDGWVDLRRKSVKDLPLNTHQDEISPRVSVIFLICIYFAPGFPCTVMKRVEHFKRVNDMQGPSVA